MPVASPEAFVAKMKAGASSPPPVVLVFGDEPLFRDQALAAYVAAVASKGPEPLTVTLHGPEGPRDPEPLELKRFLDEVRTASLFGARKLVVLRRAQHFLKTHADALAEALRSTPKGVSVAIVSEAGAKPPKALADALPCVECARPSDAPWAKGGVGGVPVAAWAADRARAEGKTLARDAAERLVALVGTNLARLASEIEKLVLLAGERPSIALADVEALCGAARSESGFPLADAVALRDARTAFRLLAAIFERGLQVGFGDSASVVSDSVGIGAILVATLHARFRALGATVELLRRGLPPEEAATAAGVKPFAARRVAADAQRHASTDFARAFEEIARADLGLKGGEDSPEFVLERLVLALAGNAVPGGAAQRPRPV